MPKQGKGSQGNGHPKQGAGAKKRRAVGGHPSANAARKGSRSYGTGGAPSTRSKRNAWQTKRKGSSFGTPRGRAQGALPTRDSSGTAGARDASRATGSIVEGRRAVAEALEASLPARRAFIAARPHSQDPTIARLARKLQERGIPIEEVSRSALDALSFHGAHQGIALEVEPYAYCDIHELIEAAGEGDALVMCLDHLEDEGNLGAIARSAECVGATGLVIAQKRAASVGAGAYKTSAGALAHLKVAQVPNIAQAVDEFKRAGFWAICASEHAQKLAWDEDLSGRVCLVMGAEGTGVSRLVRERCDKACALPQMGAIESLNVAQAATVLAYEWLRQTMAAQPASHDA